MSISLESRKTGEQPRGMANPARFPESAPSEVRTFRAILLILMTLIVPGSAHALVGRRKLGRLALKITFTMWALVLLALLISAISRSFLFTVLTQQWFLVFLSILLVAAAIWQLWLWVTLFLGLKPKLLTPRSRVVIAIVTVLGMLLTSGGLLYGAHLINTSRDLLSGIFGGGPSIAPVDGRYNVLVMGGDAGEDRVGLRPDSMTVVSIDADTGTAVMFGIPRNQQNVPFPENSPMATVFPTGYDCGDSCLMNSLYTYGSEHPDLYPGTPDPGAEAMMDAASGVTGLEIQFYVVVDMHGFVQLVDAMGGVDIDVKERTPIGTVNPVPGGPPNIIGYVETGKQHLDGDKALWFARTRIDSTDYARMQRQECLQKAILAKMDPATVLTRFKEIAAAGQQVVESNIPESQLGGFANMMLKTKDVQIQRVDFTPPNFDPTYPDYTQIHDTVRRTIDESRGGKASQALDSSAENQAASSSAATVDLSNDIVRLTAVEEQVPCTA